MPPTAGNLNLRAAAEERIDSIQTLMFQQLLIILYTVSSSAHTHQHKHQQQDHISLRACPQLCRKLYVPPFLSVNIFHHRKTTTHTAKLQYNAWSDLSITMHSTDSTCIATIGQQNLRTGQQGLSREMGVFFDAVLLQ